MGHHVVFFEQDTPYYRSHRDLVELGGRARLCLYPTWSDIRTFADATVREADAAIVTSYCPDGREACELVLGSTVARRAFYDLDTPVTLARLAAGEDVSYLPAEGLGEFDIVLSFTGGRALDELRERVGAQVVAPLYGSVDPKTHAPCPARSAWSAECSYLGTWSSDRQEALEALFVEPARRHRERPFVVGGAKYPEAVVWPPNVSHIEHVAPPDHAAFYCSSPLTLNVTRAPMAARGYCPSGRLFEAAACGVPVLSDRWQGIETFFASDEILVADCTDDAIAAMHLSRFELAAIGKRARERVLSEHSGMQRAAELLALIETDDYPGEAA
jgi:spore maturation protein CgeB